jgi:hypothetical protein
MVEPLLEDDEATGIVSGLGNTAVPLPAYAGLVVNNGAKKNTIRTARDGAATPVPRALTTVFALSHLLVVGDYRFRSEPT